MAAAFYILVAPFAGAWIEIMKYEAMKHQDKSRSPRGSVWWLKLSERFMIMKEKTNQILHSLLNPFDGSINDISHNHGNPKSIPHAIIITDPIAHFQKV